MNEWSGYGGGTRYYDSVTDLFLFLTVLRELPSDDRLESSMAVRFFTRPLRNAAKTTEIREPK